MTPPHLIVRPAFGPGVGGGHLGRCLALVQAWVDQGGTASLVGDPPGPWRRRYREAGASQFGDDPSDWPVAHGVVLDGYAFGAEDHERASQHAPLAVIADHGIGVRCGAARTIIDPNVGATPAVYDRQASNAEILAGPRFALLRRETRTQLGAQRSEPPARLAVCFGADPAEETRSLLLDAAAMLDRDIEVAVLEGVEDVGAFLAEADVVLSTGGTTVLDVLALGRPAVLISCAAHQRLVVERCATTGVAVDGGQVGATSASVLGAAVRDLIANPTRQSELARNSIGLVDGRGALRVAAQIRSTALSLRPASMSDAEVLLRWANESDTRRFAFNTGPIDFGTHVAWLRSKLADEDSLLLVAVDRSGEPLGQVRFEIGGTRAVMSVSVEVRRRGEGWGTALVIAGVRSLYGSRLAKRCSTVVAEIKDGNDRSVRAFELAGFELEAEHEDGRGRWRSYARARDA